MEFPDVGYKLSYRNVKYPRLEFRTGELLLVLPFSHDPNAVLEKHRDWIRQKIEFMAESLKDSSEKEIVDRTHEEFRSLVHFYVQEVSGELGVKVNKVFFRKMKTKWASCSPKRNLTINSLMRYLPEHLLEYVIFHEITHLVEKRHSDKFWKIISGEFSNYNEFETDLFAYWFLIHKDSTVRKLNLH